MPTHTRFELSIVKKRLQPRKEGPIKQHLELVWGECGQAKGHMPLVDWIWFDATETIKRGINVRSLSLSHSIYKVDEWMDGEEVEWVAVLRFTGFSTLFSTFQIRFNHGQLTGYLHVDKSKSTTTTSWINKNERIRERIIGGNRIKLIREEVVNG